MPPKPLSTPTSASKEPPGRSKAAVSSVLATLQRLATKKTRDGMARYGIPSDKAFGVSVGALQKLARQLGRNHELAAALWETGWYEARMLACFLDEPERVTPAQMDRWCRDFDSWAIVDTACFALFDRTPHAWQKVEQWAGREEEFVKRTAFALLWSLTVHDQQAGDEPFLRGLLLVERAASDERHFVKKAVNMALRAVGKRNPALNAAAVAVARRLASSAQPAARWVGKDALRELTSPAVTRRLAGRKKTSHQSTKGRTHEAHT
jgi:3-methyladenine DNA glycosylase AlkD